MHLTEEQAQTLAGMDVSPENVSCVSILNIWVSRQAQISIGLAAREIAAMYGLAPGEIRRSIKGEMFWHEESGELGIVICPKSDAVEYLYVKIPEGEWGFRQSEGATQ